MKSLYGQSGKKFFSPEFELIVDRDHLIISKLEPEMSEVLIEKGKTEVHSGKLILKISETEGAEILKSPSMAILDASKLNYPLKWRKWKTSDYFHPLGMPHTKRLSDYL